jgi:hypothetical protein
MATFQHIHPDSEWVFQEIARITKRYIVTIEDGKAVGQRRVPRDYSKIFPRFGFDLIHTIEGPGIERSDLPKSFSGSVLYMESNGHRGESWLNAFDSKEAD